MARKSASSSFNHSNGHPPAPEPVQETAATHPVPGTDMEEIEPHSTQSSVLSQPASTDYSLQPGGTRSLSSISIQAFALGFTLAACLSSTTLLILQGSTLWRLPAFFTCLSLFHFLEFWTTAQYNTPAVRASSFLLFSNGTAYNVAHTLAATEIVLSTFLPAYQTFLVNQFSITAGLILVVVGQVVRSVAMAQAGTNFNHIPAKSKKEGHVLVSNGVYAWLRHPSYFGFFWWALGTQILVGNKICFVGYFVALWKFFYSRIQAEELSLIDFFGNDYVEYRKRTGTGIPFVR